MRREKPRDRTTMNGGGAGLRGGKLESFNHGCRERNAEREREARLGLAEPKTSINGGGGERRRRCMVPVREQ